MKKENKQERPYDFPIEYFNNSAPASSINENYIKELEKELRLNDSNSSKSERYISDDLIKYIIDLIAPHEMSQKLFEEKFESTFKYYIDLIKKYC